MTTMTALVTGGSGFLGGLLIRRLIGEGIKCVSVDLKGPKNECNDSHATFVVGDATDQGLLFGLASRYKFDVIFHLASQIDFAVKNQKTLFDNNIGCAKAVAETAKQYKIPKVIFTSSNSVYVGNRLKRPISELDTPAPVDEYGRSKVQSEILLAGYSDFFDYISIRCPNVIDAGRIGMLSILFEFIEEGRKCWVIGKGEIRHQCIFAQDLNTALLQCIHYPKSNVFNIGSDNVPTFAEMYRAVIEHAHSRSKVVSVPGNTAIMLLRLAHRMHLSPMGEYQFRMLTSDFVFDTAKIKTELSWKPTLTNSEMLSKAYDYYIENKEKIYDGERNSANSGAVNMGILKLLKHLS
ncbi:NAD-dependent epimerase/dehydratase family protein [Syntrophorhabdus aromaticivorans]|uniref:NAD(P)-dependent oxidoreductase n=1 Tax=Syntrophorhabdus aromaticivorans TaxID=328301 RepID=A0A971M1Y7_9BACT|nr:NAD(P)-dependent oxidoreductase [Syntrophorhabdus aromaticivorans]NLW34468.1 NAD(P)-dependent oxidoreductase [Syntrophorhabdus aromaticivorans]